MQHEGSKRGAQARGAVVTRAVVPGGDAREEMAEHCEFARQARIEYAPFRLDQNVIEGAHLAACSPPDAVERLESSLIEQDAGDDVKPLIAGRSRDTGKARQALALGENFFDHKIEPVAIGRLSRLDQASKPPAILMRIAQPVDVVEPQTLQTAVRDKPADEPGNGLKRAGV